MNSRTITDAEKIVIQACEMLGFDERKIGKILDHYNEPHRFYHNCKHIAGIILHIRHLFSGEFEKSEECDLLYQAAIFHDIIYDPRSKTNEDDSIALMYEMLKDEKDPSYLKKLEGIINATKYTTNNLTQDELLFCKLDLFGLEGQFEDVLADEKKIRKEFQFVDWPVYQLERVKILDKFSRNEILLSKKAQQNILFEIEYLKFCQPNIAVYPGSFNPFHVGHLNILEKAEQIFDKVIIAIGQNPEKDNVKITRPAYLDHHQVDSYDGLLTDYLKEKSYPVTVIRGLRNTTDMQSELNQYRWLQELSNNGIRVVSIFCDKEYEHISSSSIRAMKQYGAEYYNQHIIQ